MFSGRIKSLGVKLATAFEDRARSYFAKAGASDGQTKTNQNLVGAVLAEVGTIILNVTKGDEDDHPNG